MGLLHAGTGQPPAPPLNAVAANRAINPAQGSCELSSLDDLVRALCALWVIGGGEKRCRSRVEG